MSKLALTIEPGIYRHYKGDYYDVLGTAIDHLNNTEYVVYRNSYGELQIRRTSDFTNPVAENTSRFTKVESINHLKS